MDFLAPFAGRATIVVSLAVLGYNLFFLASNHSSVALRLETFRAAVRAEDVPAGDLRLVHLLLLTLLPLSYMVLLLAAGFAWWVVLLFAAKFVFGGILSHWVQSYVLAGGEFRLLHHRLLQADSLLSVIFLAFALWVVVS